MTDRKNIGLVIPSLGPGGAERVIVTLANYLCARYNVYLIMFFKSPSHYRLNDKVQKIYLNNKYSESTNSVHAIGNNFNYCKKLIKVIKQNRLELLIAFTTSANVLSVISAKITGVKCIISERNNPLKSDINFFWKYLRKHTYPYTDLLVVQTPFIKDYYEKHLKSINVRIVPNPINDNIILNRKPYNNSRENAILTVGRLDKNKNQKLLVEAFAELNLKDWKLLIVGDGILRDELISHSQELGIENNVNFAGNVGNISDYYNSSKIFAFTSNSEGFPNALLEAMSSGLPSISTDCPSGPSEIITHDLNGFLIDVGSKEQLKINLLKLTKDKFLRKRISEESLKSTLLFKIDNIGKKWDDCISNLN